MKLKRLKALKLETHQSNRQSNRSLTEPESVSNFTSNFHVELGQKLDGKFETTDE